MKILQVGKFYHPTPGGIETVLKNLAEGLVASGDEVTVLCAAENRHASQETVNGVRIVRSARLASLMSQPLTPRMFLKLLGEHRSYDIVQFHTPNPLMEVAAFFLSHRIPQVMTYHGDVVRQKHVWPVYRHFQREFLNRIDRIVVPSRNNISASMMLSEFEPRCEVIPFGIDTSDLRLTSSVEAEVSRLRERFGRFVLFVGRLVSYKGVEVLIEAIGKLPRGSEGKAVIVGEGPLLDALKEKVREGGLGRKVHFAGKVPTAAMPAYYHACEALVLPSLSHAEAFGIVLLEAMACRKPLITTAIPTGVSFVNQKDVTGVHVPPGDAGALASAIRRIFDQPGFSRAAGEAGFQRCQEVFSRDRMVAGYRKLFARLLERPEPKVAVPPDSPDELVEPAVGTGAVARR